MIIDKIDKMFFEKNALKEALEALVEKKESEIGKKIIEIFKPLEEKLNNTSFFVVPYTHYKTMRMSILKNHGKKNSVCINIEDFKIISIDGTKDIETNEVVKIVEAFLNKI